MKIKKDDLVQVIAGKDKDRQGKVMAVDRAKNRVIVEGVNIKTKHQKPNRQNQTGSIVKTEASINASNVMFVHNGKPTRLGYSITTTQKDGKDIKVKKRIAKSTGDIID
ncbi:MAG: 50S ribosomal protein L24 [Defluviitaleaceae bacterium]|nr:50S ribosomal protein L24 [Defluviitaleaceae bacterium]